MRFDWLRLGWHGLRRVGSGPPWDRFYLLLLPVYQLCYIPAVRYAIFFLLAGLDIYIYMLQYAHSLALALSGSCAICKQQCPFLKFGLDIYIYIYVLQYAHAVTHALCPRPKPKPSVAMGSGSCAI